MELQVPTLTVCVVMLHGKGKTYLNAIITGFGISRNKGLLGNDGESENLGVELRSWCFGISCLANQLR
jgi:hypothetical protein